MAEFVQLTVKVDKSQLGALQAEVDKLKEQTINFKVDASGISAANGELIKTANTLKNGKLHQHVETYNAGLGKTLRITQTVGKTTTTTTQTMTEDFKKASLSAQLLGDSLQSIILKMAVWQLLGTGISKVIGAFREAVDTMKEVDAQLTNIQKVSGATEAEIQRIGDAAYSTASKYGVAAEEYLSAVYTFQKAGLGDSAEQMGELAVKTQLVGDTTADVASKFLVAVNAAWNLNGAYEDLSRVVDEADYINNNYATDLEKLSAGMPIVASTAANMNMSIEETLAVLGTITSKTQETGTKAATAWRALAMNIAGEIGTITDETGEAIEVTEDSIKSISDALKIYGNEAVKTAQATGQVIDPMEAVISLAEAYKEGLLTDIELENILMEVGGKLRTNQLTALVKDLASETSTYYDIMSKLPEAAGTADAEIGVMLGSWESKTQILQNTWTEFISHLVDTDVFKDALDVLTTAVDALDTDLGRAAVAALTFAAAVQVISKSAIAAKAHLGAGGLIGAISAFVGALKAGEGALAGFSAAWAASPLGIIAIAAAAVYGIVKVVDALTVTYEEQLEIVEKLNAEYDRRFGSGSEYEQLKARVDELTDSERARLNVLEGQRDAMLEEVAAAEKLATKKWLDENSRKRVRESDAGYDESGNFYSGWNTQDVINLREMTAALNEASEAFDRGEYGAERYNRVISLQVSTFKDYYDGLKAAKDAGEPLTEQEEAFIALYENAAATVARMTEAEKRNTERTEENTGAQQENAGAASEAAEAKETLAAAMEEVEKKGSLTYGTLEDLDKLYPGLSKKIVDASGNLTEQGKAALESKEAFVDLIAQEILLNNTGLDLSGQIAQLTSLATAAGVAVTSIGLLAQLGNSQNLQNEIAWRMAKSGETEEQARAAVLSRYARAVQDEIKGQAYIPTGGGSSGGSSKSSSATEKDAELERLKAIVSLRESELDFLEASGKSEDEQIAKMRDIQSALHDQAEYLRSTDAYLKDSFRAHRFWSVPSPSTMQLLMLPSTSTTHWSPTASSAALET